MVHYSTREGALWVKFYTSARATEAVRRAIQHSEESLRILAKRYGISQKTVAKWKRRTVVKNLPTSPKVVRSTTLSIEEEAIIVAFRRHTLLPLDDCLYTLRATIPHLTRSSLHRYLQRHKISQLPDVTGDKEPKRKFKIYAIGYFHIDIAEVHTTEGKLYLYVAIDRASKFAVVHLVTKTGRTSAFAFLVALIAAVPYRIHTVLTDNGIQFTFPPRYADGPTATYMTHMLDVRCRENGIEPSVGSVGDSYDNARAETINGLFKVELIHRRGPWRHAEAMEFANLEWVDWFNHRRLLKSIGNIPPADAGARYYAQLEAMALAA